MPVQDDAIASTSHDDNHQGLSSLRRNGPILVKLNFPNKKRKTKRSKVLKQANKRIKELSKKVTHLTKRKKRYQRVSKTTQRKTNHHFAKVNV